ncbi:ABC transporter substrate-binding protein [Hathewaya massiliensis]|uniref:ABC transporter substrate-binding protein n=1 Tax=Hathewaya massiliensis TaxID=1964382 RepID=UPI00115709F9|nr:ABC transporter substrate-binding protein [Hathewaya massiliensis]
MVAKKLSKLLVCVFLVSTLGACANRTSSNSNENKSKEQSQKQIGITQIVEHPALDASKEGFIEALKEGGFEDGKNIKIDFQNAQGDTATTDTIAKKFVSDKKDLVFAISTPSAQAVFNATKEIPIVITAITDPVNAGLVRDMKSSGNNVTGTSDKTPIRKQLELLKKIKADTKTIGVIYNTSEANSEVQVRELKEEARAMNIKVLEGGITSINEVPQVLGGLLDKVDVLYTPADNMVASSLSLISKKAEEKKVPVFGAEKAHVEQGALITLGVDYKELGHESGKKAVEILKGKKPSEIPVTMQENFKTVVNEKTMKTLNIKIPKNILESAEKVTGGGK